jgi:hypothetical protein
VGVGSDTTQDVLNALATKYNAAHPGAPKLASYDATGSANIKPKAGKAAILRPVGSGKGIAALLADTTGSIDFARSSAAKAGDGSQANLSFFALAQDGVAWATYFKTNAPKSLTKAQLGRIYRCAGNAVYWDQVGGKKTVVKKGKKKITKRNRIKPWLPQTGSGTRKFFLTAIGLTDAQVGSCVNQGTVKKVNIENNGKLLGKDQNVIAPYSIGKWIAQAVNHKVDDHGLTVLHQISKVSPVTGGLKVNAKTGKVTGKHVRINTGDFPRQFLRLVYDVVRNKDVAKFTPIFGADGWICDQPAIIRSYGFEPLGGGCGAIS